MRVLTVLACSCQELAELVVSGFGVNTAAITGKTCLGALGHLNQDPV